jgi:hypothetical protein
LLVEGLHKKVVVTENGRRRKITVREAVVEQLINKSATADLRATKMLLDMIRTPRTRPARQRHPSRPRPSPRRTRRSLNS